MTTIIYFFLMSLILFILPQLLVKAITKENIKINSNLIYLVFAFILPLIWIFIPLELRDNRFINFLQHSIGGGVAVGFVGFYLIQSLDSLWPLLKKFPIQFIFVYLLVSGFGVANELLEFLLDTFGVGIFSADRYDTWFDLFANTSGAIIIFLVLYLINKSLNNFEFTH